MSEHIDEEVKNEVSENKKEYKSGETGINPIIEDEIIDEPNKSISKNTDSDVSGIAN